MQQLLRLAFFLSGIAALLYQMLWTRLMGHLLGTNTEALGLVTATFMAGLAIGGVLFGRAADRAKQPLFLYAGIEVGTALLGGGVVLLNGPLGRVVAAVGAGASDSGGYAVRALFAVLVLLAPAALIGGTLPVMIRAVARRLTNVGEDVGHLYFVNTLGAAVGVALAGFVLFELIGLHASALVAMSLNVLVAGIALFIARSPGADVVGPAGEAAGEAAVVAAAPSTPLHRVAAAAFFLSGFSGLALEVLWTRWLFGFIPAGQGNFALLLSSLLLGLAFGGVLGARIADRAPSPLAAAGVAFSVVGVMVLVGLRSLTIFDDMPPADRFIPGELYVVPIVGMVLPAAAAMGVLFPLLVKALLRDLGHIGADAGRYYAVNTAGTVLGSIGASFVAIPLLGIAQTTVVLALASIVVGALLVASARPVDRRVLVALASAGLVAVALAPSAWDSFHRQIDAMAKEELAFWSEERAWIEGSESTVALYRATDGRHRVVVNAFPFVAASGNETKVMAHLPLLLAPEARRSLVICFGMGNTFRSALSHGGEVDVVDINAHIPRLTSIHRGPDDKTLSNPRGKVHINDGRNFLLMTDQKYDMITVDPAPPIWSMGMQNLYSKEFFELARDHLTDGGVMVQWTPSGAAEDFKPILRAFVDVFPYVEVFQGVEAPDAHYLVGSSVLLHREGLAPE